MLVIYCYLEAGCWLPVYYGERVQVVECGDDLCRVEEGCAAVEPAGTAEVAEQLPARHVGEQHVEEALVFGVPGQIHQEGVVNLLQKRFFLTSIFINRKTSKNIENCLQSTRLWVLSNYDIRS